jgi:hypothetical protein
VQAQFHFGGVNDAMLKRYLSKKKKVSTIQSIIEEIDKTMGGLRNDIEITIEVNNLKLCMLSFIIWW